MKWYHWAGIAVGVVVVGGVAASVLSRPSSPELPTGPIQPPPTGYQAPATDAGAEVARGVTSVLGEVTRAVSQKVARDDAARERQRDREAANAELHADKGVAIRNAEANAEA